MPSYFALASSSPRKMRASPCVEIVVSPAARLDFLLRDYANLGDDPQLLAQQLHHLRELHGGEVIARWQAWARERNLAALFGELMARHYDPLYARSQGTNLQQWEQRQSVAAQALTPADIERLANAVMALPWNGLNAESPLPDSGKNL